MSQIGMTGNALRLPVSFTSEESAALHEILGEVADDLIDLPLEARQRIDGLG